MDDIDDTSEYKLYTVNPYFNSDKEPMRLTFKGKAKEYKFAHECIKKSIKKGAEIVLSNGKFKVVELPIKKAMTNALVELEASDGTEGNVEMKIYEPSLKKNKGATIELRTVTGSQYVHVEKLRDILIKLLDNLIAGKDPLKTFKRICHKPTQAGIISSKPKRFVCDICNWETKLSSGLKAHMIKLHSDNKEFECSKCQHRAQSTDSLSIHIATQHCTNRKRPLPNFKCEICDSCFKSKVRLTAHHVDQHSGYSSKEGLLLILKASNTQ